MFRRIESVNPDQSAVDKRNGYLIPRCNPDILHQYVVQWTGQDGILDQVIIELLGQLLRRIEVQKDPFIGKIPFNRADQGVFGILLPLTALLEQVFLVFSYLLKKVSVLWVHWQHFSSPFIKRGGCFQPPKPRID